MMARIAGLLSSLLLLTRICHAWVPSGVCGTRVVVDARRVMMTTTSTSEASITTTKEDDEWEYVEYQSLTEADLVGSEWLVGSNWKDRELTNVEETWVRLVTTEEGRNKAFWGDRSEGTWSLDKSNQYFSVTKSTFYGKKIWAGIVDDYYYFQGTIRGWNLWSPAAVYGQWQAKRLGIDSEEAGIAPWFEEDDEEESKPSEDSSQQEEQ